MVLITSIPQQLVKDYGATDASTAIGSGSYDGQTYLQVGGSSQGYRRNIWVWDSALGAWSCVPCSPIIGTATPIGAVTPDSLGQQFLNTTTTNLYVATGLTNNDWTLTN